MKVTQEELNEIVRKHKLWLNKEQGGARADLEYRDISGLCLAGADLSKAKMTGVIASHLKAEWARFDKAAMAMADLRGIVASGSSFFCTDVSSANASNASFLNANLSGANLFFSNLVGANFTGANLTGALLHGANIAIAKFVDATCGNICRIDFGGWTVFVGPTKTQIGCRLVDNEEWLKFEWESPEIRSFSSTAPEWWRVHGDTVKAAIRCVMSKKTK